MNTTEHHENLISTLEQTINNLNRELVKYRDSNIEELKKEILDLNLKLEESTNINKELVKQVDSTIDEIEELENEISDHKIQIRDLEYYTEDSKLPFIEELLDLLESSIGSSLKNQMNLIDILNSTDFAYTKF